MRFRGVWVGGIAALALGASASAEPAAAAARAAPAPSPHARTAVLSTGAWCWFADPRAVQIAGRLARTFVGWIGWDGAITIATYAPSFGVIQTSVVAHLYHDDHSSPALLVEPDRRLTVFWSGHNGAQMYYRSTTAPADISNWGPVQAVPSHRYGRKGFTYPNPVSLSAEHHRVYLFWRGEDYSQDFAIRGQTGGWTEGRRLIADRGQRPYVKVDSDGKATIGLAFTDGHPRETLTSVYYAAYRHGSLWTAAGRRISSLARAPIAPRQAQLVYDGHRTRTPSWVWDVALGHSGHPVIVYATFPASGDHAYWYARWDGRQWVSRFLAYGGPTISPGTIEREYSGGMALDHEHPSIVYLSRRVRGRFQIERWSTADAGRSFQHTTVVRNGTDNVRPVVPRGWNGGPMGLLWLRGRYGTYTSYRTSISYLR